MILLDHTRFYRISFCGFYVGDRFGFMEFVILLFLKVDCIGNMDVGVQTAIFPE